MKRNIGLLLIGMCFGVIICFVLAFIISIYGASTVSTPASVPIQRPTWIASESPQLIHSTSVPKSTNTPQPTSTHRPTSTPEFGTVRNPIPLGQKVYLVQDGVSDFEISILSVIRGRDAWVKIYSANQFNDKAPDGMEYVIAEIQVSHTGSDSGIVEVNSAYWKIVSNKRYFDSFSGNSFVCCLSPNLDLSLGAGGEGIGLLALPVFIDDQSPMLVFGDKFYFLLN